MNIEINGGREYLSAFPGKMIDKEILVDWCYEHFGEVTDEDELWWNIRSEYDDPRSWPCPFEFDTNCEKMLTLFMLRWS